MNGRITRDPICGERVASVVHPDAGNNDNIRKGHAVHG